MLQCFVRGCKQAQVAAGSKLQDHDLILEPVHSLTFFPFSFLHITAVTFSKYKPCKSLVSAGNGFLSTDSVYRSLLKISWQENLMILSTGWVKKFQGVPLNLNKAFLCEKKASKDDEVAVIAHHVLSSDGLIARYLVIRWIRTVAQFRGGGGHHMDGEVINQWIYSTDWPKSHTKAAFLRRPRPEAGRQYSTSQWPGEEIRSRAVQTMIDTRLLQNAVGPSFRSSC